MNQSPKWQVSVAAVLDVIRKYHEALHEATAMTYALRNTLKELDPSFEQVFQRNYTAIVTELSDANHLSLHMLEKIAGQLRDDPTWKD